MKRLLISAYCVNFNGYEQLLDILKSLEFANAGAELSMFSRTSAYPGFMEELNQWREPFSPYYLTFHGPYKEVEATSPLAGPAHQIMLEAYRDAFWTYRQFGAHSIVMHTNQRIHLTHDNTQLKANCISTIKELAAMAKDQDVKLCVENVGIPGFDNVLFPMEDFIRLFDRLPDHVNCLIDVGHAFLNRWDLDYVIRTLGSRITSYHLHNNDGQRDSHRPMYEEGGFFQDWTGLFSSMERWTPDAEWILEYAPGKHITAELMINEVKNVLAQLKQVSHLHNI